MNREQQKNIFEAVGVVAIVASLIFLSLEIRQSNVQARAAAYQAIGIATAAASVVGIRLCRGQKRTPKIFTWVATYSTQRTPS